MFSAMIAVWAILPGCSMSGIIATSSASVEAEGTTQTMAAAENNAMRYGVNETAKTERLEIKVLDQEDRGAGGKNKEKSDIYLLEICLSVKNIGGDKIEFTPGMFRVKLADGTTRDEAILTDDALNKKRLLNGVLDPGLSREGSVYFEVPRGSGMTLVVNTAGDGSSQVCFSLS